MTLNKIPFFHREINVINSKKIFLLKSAEKYVINGLILSAEKIKILSSRLNDHIA